jgi:IS1 family transposase
VFYADNWDAFAEVLPPKRHHVIGKSGTVTIERDTSNTRHHLGRITRCTKVVSKIKTMMDLRIRLWRALTNTAIFNLWQENLLYIFR